jgi:hypothetical protein
MLFNSLGEALLGGHCRALLRKQVSYLLANDRMLANKMLFNSLL